MNIGTPLTSGNNGAFSFNVPIGKNEEALPMWNKVLELNPNFLKDNPDGTELSNGLKKLGLIE